MKNALSITLKDIEKLLSKINLDQKLERISKSLKEREEFESEFTSSETRPPNISKT